MDEKQFKNELDEAMKLFQKRDFEAALNKFNTLLEADNKNAHLYNNIGLCYANLGQNAQAEEYYKKALFLDDKLVETYINIADIYYKENRLWDAIELLQEATARIPDNVALLHYLGRIYIEDKRYDDAIDDMLDENENGDIDLL